MTPKEQLREKFVELTADLEDCIHNSGFHQHLCDNLMAAVDEIMGKPLHITIKPSDEQLEEMRKQFQSAAFQIWAYGDPSVPHVPSYGDNT